MEEIYQEPNSMSGLSDELREIDQELAELLKKQTAKIKVIGIGGGGGNSLSRMREIGIKGGELIAINTDAQDLLYANADKKILIGRELTMGLGAGSNPKVGQEAAKESESEIKKKIAGSDMIFITCGLGGGTGTGAAPVVAALAKKQGALTIGVVTLPFTIEGRKRIENAMEGLERMEATVDTLIVIPNDKLLELAPDLPLHTAFKISDEILTNAVKGVTELVTTSGLVNLDFADVRAIMSNGGVSLIGMGESDTKDRALDAVEKAIDNPLLDVDISDATGALVNIIGGSDMSLEECKLIIETIGNKLSPDAKLIWGAQISEDMEKSIRVLLIVTGVKSSQILGHGESIESIKHREIEDELGIEFLNKMEFKTQEDFSEYLKSLESEKPFNCPYLIVLPENVSIDINLPGRRDYNKKDLLCIRSVEVSQHALSDHKCGIHGSPKLMEDRNLEIGCDWSPFLNKRWKIKVFE